MIRNINIQHRVIFLTILLVLQIKGAYSQNLDMLKADIENLGNFGVRPLSFGKEHYLTAQGSLYYTNMETDFAIVGEGYFVVFDTANNRLLLTRNGSFSYNLSNILVNHEGMPVLSNKSDIANYRGFPKTSAFGKATLNLREKAGF